MLVELCKALMPSGCGSPCTHIMMTNRMALPLALHARHKHSCPLLRSLRAGLIVEVLDMRLNSTLRCKHPGGGMLDGCLRMRCR